MGYDAMALGEGDLARLGVSEIRERMKEARFPFLSANVVISGSGELLARPYITRQVDGHRIAIIGLTGKASLPGVEIRDPLTVAVEVVTRLRKQADIVILVSHAGLQVNQKIAAAVPGLDLIVSGGKGGYTPSPMSTKGGAVIVHADAPSPGHAGRRVGVGHWTFDAQGKITAQKWQSVALGPNIPSDPDMQAWAAKHR